MGKAFKSILPILAALTLAGCGGGGASSTSSSSSSKTSSSEPISVPSSSSSVAPTSESSSEAPSSESSIESSSEPTSIPSSSASSSEEKYNGIDHDVRLEAEDGVIDGSKTKASDCPNASGGKIAADINDCGQGLQWQYFAPVGGSHYVDVAYWTGSANSKHQFIVNGTYSSVVLYENANGWANGTNDALTVRVSITLTKGWNNIELIKNGIDTDVPEYGGWAQVDYIDIIGTLEQYDKTALDFTLNEFTYEAEHCYFLTGGVPFTSTGLYSGYAIGEINAVGHGITLRFAAPRTGTYKMKLVYGQGGNNNNAVVSFNGNTGILALEPYEGQAYNVTNMIETGLIAELEEGDPCVVSVTRATTSDWFIIDRIIFEAVIE